jgi:CBS domain-containing protein
MTDKASAQIEKAGPMHAQDIMTSEVVSVPPDMPAGAIAKVLFEKRISAVPVVTGDGEPIGMVSEGDLIPRDEQERLSRGDWWLAVLSGSRALTEPSKDRPPDSERTARDIMSAPLVAVAENTEIGEIARLLTVHHIKRVPVLRDGRLVGIVSRADLVHVIASGQATESAQHKAAHRNFLSGLFGGYRLPVWETVAGNMPAAQAAKRDDMQLTAGDLQHVVEDFQHTTAQQADAARRAAAKQRADEVHALIDAHVSDEAWRHIMHQACEAAQQGQQEVMLDRFPSQLCVDGGRTINTDEQDWPVTLRGKPAEMYLRWERDLKPHGFHLTARVMDFRGGKPGDVGLFLFWGG